jgi:hypothetical protein
MFASIRLAIVTLFTALTHLIKGVGNVAEGFEEVTNALPIQGKLISDEAKHEAAIKRLEWDKQLSQA